MQIVSSLDPPVDGAEPLHSRAQRREAQKRARVVHRQARTATRACGYGSIAVSAWLLTAVATGYGVAAADSTSSSSPESSSESSSAGTPSSDSDSTSSSSYSSRRTPKSPGTNSAPPSSDPADAAESTSPGDLSSDPDDENSVDTESTTPGTASEEEAAGTVDEPIPVEVSTPTLPENPDTPTVPQSPEPEAAEPGTPTAGAGDSATETTGSPARGSSYSGTRPAAGKTPSTPAAPAPVGQDSKTIRYAAGAAPELKPAGRDSVNAASPLTETPSAVTPTATTIGQGITSAPAVPSPGPLGMIVNAVNTFISAIFSPLMTSLPEAPSGQNPVAWAVLAFVRRNFFNEAPTVTSVNIGQQQSTGVITGHIDAVDPDELGKTVTINANVYAAPAQPRVPEPGCECATVDGFQGLPFTNAASLGTAPGSTWFAPDAVDNTCVYIGADGRVTYTGTETGEVTITGLGTGDVTLVFEGLLLSATEERSVAQLQSHLGTGDLKGVKGTVVSESTLDATGAATGVLTGEVVRPDLRYKVVKQATHGTVVVDEVSGQFTYTPDPGFAEQGGDDSFQIVVTDNRFNLFKIFQPYNGDPVQTVNLSVAGTLATSPAQV